MKCMKTWNKLQKEGQNRLTGLERGKPCKKSGGKRQKICGLALSNSEREKKFENPFWKESLNKPNLIFKKPDSRVSIDRKSVLIDQNR